VDANRLLDAVDRELAGRALPEPVAQQALRTEP